jgi:hypothetical protein
VPSSDGAGGSGFEKGIEQADVSLSLSVRDKLEVLAGFVSGESVAMRDSSEA